jgi:ammonia channel protein AmtB
VWIICWTAFGTFIVFTVVKFLVGGLRESDDVLREGDIAIHEEEAFPEPTFGEPMQTPSHVHSDNV